MKDVWGEVFASLARLSAAASTAAECLKDARIVFMPFRARGPARRKNMHKAMRLMKEGIAHD